MEMTGTRSNNLYNNSSNMAAAAPVAAPSAQKRPREISIPEPDVQDLVVEIHQALTTKQRLAMLRHVYQVLSSHNNTDNNKNDDDDTSSLFVWLLEAGMLEALILQLAFVLNRRQGATIAQEVTELCRVLALFLRNCPPSGEASEMVWSCLSGGEEGATGSRDRQSAHRPQKGGSDFMRLLSSAFEQWPEAQLHILAILHAISGREKGTEVVMSSRVISLRVVDALRSNNNNNNCDHQNQQQHHHHHHNNNKSSNKSIQNLLQALGLIKNISYFQKDSWNVLVEIPGFLSALSSLTHYQQDEKCRERLSAIWRNFAVSEASRSSLLVAQQHSCVLASICSLATNNTNDCVAVNRNFLTILVSLSMDTESSLLLMLHADGVLTHVLQRLLIQSKSDPVVRKRAARVIRLWASHETTGALLVHCPDLLKVISNVAKNEQEDQQVRHEAAEALGRCASWIAAPMPQHVAVLDALVCLCQVSSSSSVIARALKGQAAHANNRLLLTQRPIFVNCLTRIALDSTSPSVARADACCALADLAAEEGNRRRLVTSMESSSGSSGRDDDESFSNQLLEALRVNALTTVSSRRDYAAQTLVYLAEDKANRTAMAQHSQLLQALIQYAAVTLDSSPIKQSVKAVILKIVHEL